MLVGAGLSLTGAPKPPVLEVGKAADEREAVVTVFLTGNELGTLKPCGCTGGQLGGLDRRMAVFDSVPAANRLIVDTGSLVEGQEEQDQIKFNIVVQAYNLFGYDVVNLSEGDIETATELGLLEDMGSLFHILSSQEVGDGERGSGAAPEGELKIPSTFSKQFSMVGQPVTVTVSAFDSASGGGEGIASAFKPAAAGKAVNILIVNECSSEFIASVAKSGGVDCLVCPAESDKPEAISEPGKRPLVVTPGRVGKYVGRLEIRAVKAGDKVELGFSAVPISGDLPQEPSLVDLYKLYQEDVKEADLLEKQHRMPLPNSATYVGSDTCKMCHKYPYDMWKKQGHAHAYATLEKVGSQYDPECVACHVVGLEYDGGFVGEDTTEHLKEVGCEVCHGPGSEHVGAPEKKKTTQPMKDCIDCHTPEHSGGFAENEAVYLQKIVHWREPKAVGNVK